MALQISSHVTRTVIKSIPLMVFSEKYGYIIGLKLLAAEQ